MTVATKKRDSILLVKIVDLHLTLKAPRNKKCHKHVTNSPKGIGLAYDTLRKDSCNIARKT